METDQSEFLKATPCHFNWNLHQDCTKTFDSIKDSLEEHLSQNPGQRTIESYLFLSYLFMSEFKQDEKEPVAAIENIKKAKDEIIRTTQENSPARIGFMTVALSNEALIASMRSEGREVRKLEKEIKRLFELSTQESQIYVDVVHAFSLSRLGMSNYQEAKDLYETAVAKFRNDISTARSEVAREPEKLHWLFALALMTGRIARHLAGPGNFSDEMNEEIEIFEMILNINPDYTLACAHLAQCYSLKKDKQKCMQCCLNAIKQAPDNPSVLRITGKTLRKEKCFDEAMTVFEQCESLGAKNSYLYHQLGLIFRAKYFEQKNRSYNSTFRGRGHHYSRGRSCNDRRSGHRTTYIDLLHRSIEYFTKAYDFGSRNCMALLDRARSYEELKDVENARADYEKLVSLPKVEVPFVVVIHYNYGLFLQKHDQVNDALDHFNTAIDNYCSITPESELHTGGTGNDGERAMTRVTKIAEDMTLDESVEQRIRGHRYLAKVLCIKGKYGLACEEYENCLSVKDNWSDLGVLKNMVNCLLHMKEFRRAETYIDKLDQYEDISTLQIKLLLLEGDFEYTEGRYKEARSILSKAVQMGSLEACDKLLHLLERTDKDEQIQTEFRSQCAAILFCHSKAHQDDIQQINDKTSMIGIAEDKNRRPDGEGIPPTKSDRIKSLVDIKDDVMGDVRKAIMDLEQKIIGNSHKETAETFNASLCVIDRVHEVLEHSIAAFRDKFYPRSKNCSSYVYVPARDNVTYDDVKNELLRLFIGTNEDNENNNTNCIWIDFEARFPDFVDFLVKIQPGYNRDNNWFIAVAKLHNLHKQDPEFFQHYMCDAYDIPVAVKGSGDSSKDVDHIVPAGNFVIKFPVTVMPKLSKHPDVEYDTFCIRDLARKAATEVERIVSAFFAEINSPELCE